MLWGMVTVAANSINEVLHTPQWNTWYSTQDKIGVYAYTQQYILYMHDVAMAF